MESGGRRRPDGSHYARSRLGNYFVEFCFRGMFFGVKKYNCVLGKDFFLGADDCYLIGPIKLPWFRWGGV